MKKIELLAPAGTPDALSAAMDAGADACYLGLKDFNARMRGGNFAYNQVEAAIDQAHQHNKKIYITFNTLLTESEVDKAYSTLSYLSDIGPDALIVQDMGIAQLINTKFRRLKWHASTQAAAASSSAVKFLADKGAERVVVARELSLEEIASIKQAAPDVELEVFCHGALCIAYSGLCLFSSYLGGMSANRGRCTQACRRVYQSKNQQGNFFSPRDLQTIEIIPKLAALGVESLKIEGRMKSGGYVHSVVSAYRYVLDHLEDEERAVAVAKERLQNDFARSKTDFFMTNRYNTSFINADLSGATGRFLGALVNHQGQFYIDFEGELEHGDYLRVQRPDDSARFTLKIKEPLRQEWGYPIEVAEAQEGDLVYLSAKKEAKFPPFLPANLDSYQKKPSFIKAPPLKPLDFAGKAWPEGSYVLFSKLEDVGALGAQQPAMIWLEASATMIKALKTPKRPLPLKKEAIALYLEPFLAEEKVKSLQGNVEQLMQMGFTRFVANNSAHVWLLKKLKADYIAGPWLYVHNRFALDFWRQAECRAITFPFETSLTTVSSLVQSGKDRLIAPLFGRPELFQMRSNLQELYNFETLADREEASYHILANKEGSKVIPRQPFSAVHLRQQLQQKGIKRFLYDFRYQSGSKEIAVILGKEHKRPLNNSRLFNWEHGFKND